MRSITAMLASRPVIFISAVSKELRSTRDLVAKTLTALGYEPKWQDIAPTETGDLRTVLRKWVDGSHAVLQIVGHRYGFAPDQPDETFGKVSYTQYEALYAKAKGKKVWYIILDEDHPTDCPDDEPEDLKKLQSDYRIQVKAHHGLYHNSPALLTTENIVLKLRDDLAKLRRRSRQWASANIGLLLFTICGIGWLAVKQKDTGAEVAAMREENKILKDALRNFADALTAAQKANPQADKITQQTSAYTYLDETHHLPPGTLEKKLPAFAEKLLAAKDTLLMDRAIAAFVLKNYAEAETIALQAKDAAISADPPSLKNAIEALSLAGQSAKEQIQYKRAIEHYRAAATLTGEERDVLEWAGIQNEIGWLLYLDGQYDAQATVVYRVWQACEKSGHQESPYSLGSHSLWANALNSKGRFAEAEKEYRAVLIIQERVLGPVHPDTLSNRNNLASILYSQGKYADAEKEYRAVLALHEHVLGLEHPNTLSNRMGVANSLYSQRKYAEAEKEHHEVAVIQGRIIGPEHPDTLKSRNNLASALYSQGNYADAEKEYRAVLAISVRVLGPEHPHSLSSIWGIAGVLHAQRKYTEAEKEYRALLAIQERVLGQEHPDVFSSCCNLSLCLEAQEKKTEALEFGRRALTGRTKVLGMDHPDTKSAKQQVEDLEKP